MPEQKIIEQPKDWPDAAIELIDKLPSEALTVLVAFIVVTFITIFWRKR